MYVEFEMRDWGALTNSECEKWNELAGNAEECGMRSVE